VPTKFHYKGRNRRSKFFRLWWDSQVNCSERLRSNYKPFEISIWPTSASPIRYFQEIYFLRWPHWRLIFTTRARRQYLVNHILDRSDRRNSALNIAASGKPAETVPAPATTSTQPPSSLQITPWATTSATSSSDYPRQSISMLKLSPLVIHNFLYIYIPW